MDPISIIVTALVTGATFFAKGIFTEAGKNTYQTLKDQIMKKIKKNDAADTVLSKFEENPSLWESQLKDLLLMNKIEEDQEILTSSQQLLSIIHSNQNNSGKYNVTFNGQVKGYAQGDHMHINMNFSDDKTNE